MNPFNRHSFRLSISWFLFVWGLLLASARSGRAQLVYTDSFSYPDGEIVGASGSPWIVNYLPADGANVVSGRLFLTDTNQESVRVDFGGDFTDGFVYARMTVNFARLPAGDGNLFACFRGNNTDNLRGRIWASTNGAVPGRFRLGLRASADPVQMIPRDLYLGTNYTLVCRYEVSNSFCSLWLDPRDESDTNARVDCLTDYGKWTIGQFAFLQTAFYQAGAGNYIGALAVDNLRIGRTFEEVLPSVAFKSISNMVGGAVSLRASGQATTNYVLQATTNFSSTNWVSLSTNAAGTNGIFNVSDSNAASFPNRFYRLLKQ